MATQPTFDESFYGLEFLFENKSLNAEQVREFENRLLTNANDLEVHARLACFYMWQGMRRTNRFLALLSLLSGNKNEPAFKKKFREHVLWIIENYPLSKVSADPIVMTMALGDPLGCKLGSEVWLRHVEENPSHAEILSHAATFLWYSDKKKSMELKQKACDLEPNNPDYLRDLATTYSVMARKTSNENSRQKAWQLALLQKEKEYANCLQHNKSKVLVELSEYASNAGDLEKAQRYAEELRNSTRRS